jgi:hypothetical protein
MLQAYKLQEDSTYLKTPRIFIEDLIRAEKKEQSLKAIFKDSGMTNLDE